MDGVLVAYAEGVTIPGVGDVIVDVPSAVETGVVKIGVFCVAKIGVLSAVKIGVLSLVIELITDGLVKVIAEVAFPGHVPGTVRGTVSVDSLVEVEVTAPGHNFGIVIVNSESLVNIQGPSLKLVSPNVEIRLF